MEWRVRRGVPAGPVLPGSRRLLAAAEPEHWAATPTTRRLPATPGVTQLHHRQAAGAENLSPVQLGNHRRLTAAPVTQVTPVGSVAPLTPDVPVGSVGGSVAAKWGTGTARFDF